jgi:hypothetical protein
MVMPPRRHDEQWKTDHPANKAIADGRPKLCAEIVDRKTKKSCE